MTLMALVVAVTAGAQGTTIHEYPWNPDSNNDNLIGVDDLLDFLPVFGDEFGNPPEPCDYDGTPLEEWWGQVIREISLSIPSSSNSCSQTAQRSFTLDVQNLLWIPWSLAGMK